jgi:hypothetical protein
MGSLRHQRMLLLTPSARRAIRRARHQRTLRHGRRGRVCAARLVLPAEQHAAPPLPAKLPGLLPLRSASLRTVLYNARKLMHVRCSIGLLRIALVLCGACCGAVTAVGGTILRDMDSLTVGGEVACLESYGGKWSPDLGGTCTARACVCVCWRSVPVPSSVRQKWPPGRGGTRLVRLCS